MNESNLMMEISEAWQDLEDGLRNAGAPPERVEFLKQMFFSAVWRTTAAVRMAAQKISSRDELEEALRQLMNESYKNAAPREQIRCE